MSFVRLPHVTRSAALVMVVVAAPGLAQSMRAAASHLASPVQDARDRFVRLSPRRQEQALERVLEAVAARPVTTWTAPAVIAATLDEDAEPRHRRARDRDLGRGSETARAACPLVSQLPVPARVHWRFGFGVVEPLHEGRRPSRRDLRAWREAAVEALCRGEDLAIDRAFAALVARLDVERGFDEIAMLLETWRNGDESMYEALDRTAGRDEGVFHYDAMLGDFVRSCVSDDHPDRRRFVKSTQDACAGFRRSFEAWCARRSLIEMVALTCLIGPDMPLPGRLMRYENKTPGTHSMRELVELIVIAHDGDVLAACDAIAAQFEPLDGAPWQRGDAKEYRAVVRAYEEIEPKLLANGRSTFEILVASREQRRQARVVRAQHATEAAIAALAR